MREKKIVEDILGEDRVKQFRKMDVDAEQLLHLYHQLDRDKEVFKARAEKILESDHIKEIDRGTDEVIQSLIQEIEDRQTIRRQVISDAFLGDTEV